MKIFCVGRNYLQHAKEMSVTVPKEPVIFMKPETALVRQVSSLPIPSFTQDLQHELELVLRISKSGKNLSKKKAFDYFDAISVGIDFTARDLQAQLKEKSLPWEISKSFDQSALIGRFLAKSEKVTNLRFSLLKNNDLVQSGNSQEMLFSFDTIISYISQYFTLEKGDLIFTGTPEGVGSLKDGDQLEGYIENEQLFSVTMRQDKE